MKHVLAHRASPPPHFDSTEVHRGYMLTKCLDKFLEALLANISGAWRYFKSFICSYVPNTRHHQHDLGKLEKADYKLFFVVRGAKFKGPGSNRNI